MKKSLPLLFILFFSCFVSRSQTILESDSLKSQAVFYVPEISVTQLNNIKAEFANYPEIQKAIYVYQTHNCIVVDISAEVAHPRLVFYRDLMKIVVGFVGRDNVFIKTPAAYAEIMGSAANDLSNFTLK